MPKLTEVEIIDKLRRPRAGSGMATSGPDVAIPVISSRIEFVNQVALLIEKTDHYPDIHVSFRNVRLGCPHRRGRVDHISTSP